MSRLLMTSVCLCICTSLFLPTKILHHHHHCIISVIYSSSICVCFPGKHCQSRFKWVLRWLCWWWFCYWERPLKGRLCLSDLQTFLTSASVFSLIYILMLVMQSKLFGKTLMSWTSYTSSTKSIFQYFMILLIALMVPILINLWFTLNTFPFSPKNTFKLETQSQLNVDSNHC